ncbi:MAG TPA: STAS/SEC14 domain-containing protein [Pedobacter sp.]|uniref:STAS/SEC14 domain-containing protein n=1 Tax=Pedobacter sp. TaxID=1411316 RepID=UPI002CE227DF|nr:STAS/SEC14 domain-containing protein [Pedobacter sp.]HMI05747.1 STAS/SEC14 domain-containing protein [Pedobacter sp.]
MLTIIQNVPEYVFAVKASGEVTDEDLKSVLLPGLNVLSAQYGEIYYLLVLDTSVENFTAGAWVQDFIAGVKHLTKWKKMAVVTDQKAVKTFTDLFSYIVPGEARGFEHAELKEAIDWVSKKLE